MVERTVEIDIRPYEGQKAAEFEIGGVKRTGRVDQVEPDLWIVGNDPECFNDIAFIEQTSEKMAELLRPYNVDCLFAPATRAIMTAFKTAELLGHSQIAIARKNIFPEAPIILEEPTRSITSGKEEKIMIDGETAEILKGKRVAIFDDVISQGGTVKGLMGLARQAGAEIVAISTVGIEGTAPYNVFEEEFRQGKLVYLAVLPLFAQGQIYTNLMEEKGKVEERFRYLPTSKSVLKP